MMTSILIIRKYLLIWNELPFFKLNPSPDNLLHSVVNAKDELFFFPCMGKKRGRKDFVQSVSLKIG